MRATVRQITQLAEGIRAFRLVGADGGPLPDFTPGAHIDVTLPGGLIRQYSLINAAGESHYRIAVNLDANSRGGSRCLHQDVAEGDVLEIGGPRNHFPLTEDAPLTVLIAGGIGITPLFAMAARLARLGRRWRLYHCTRTPARTPFVDELRALVRDHPGGEVIHLHDAVPGIRPLDMAAIATEAPAGTHFYACGPEPMLAAFLAATASRPPAMVHVERFAAVAPAPQGDDAAFDVICARSNLRVAVAPGQSILAALEAQGIAPLCSCREGICGTCETAILEGEPDHRDAVLTPEERAEGRTMMICVSRARGRELTLDL